MNRRAFVFASIAASWAASAALGPAQAASDIKIIYVGAWDCPPCTQWKNTHKAKWLASPEFQQVTWIEVDPPKLKEAYQERYWPGDLKPILDQLPRQERYAALPDRQGRQGRFQRVRRQQVARDDDRPQEDSGVIIWQAPSTAWSFST